MREIGMRKNGNGTRKNIRTNEAFQVNVNDSNMTKIKVSIIIPTYNRQKSLLRTLDSLFIQTFPQENLEIIIVDDGSTDDTETLIQETKKSHENLVYIKQENKGAASARNLGILHSKGDIIGFTDDDCVPAPTWIESALPYFNSKNVCGVQGVTLPLHKVSQKNKIFNFTDVVTFKGNEKINYYPTCNIFYMKKHLIEVGCFDEKLYSWTEDTDLAYRLIKRGYTINLSSNAVVYHEVRYINIFNYIFKRKKRLVSFPLFVKKHPEVRSTFSLRYIHSPIYPIMLIVSLFSLLFESKLFCLFALITVLSYLRNRVLTDSNVKMYPVRIVGVYRYLPVDIATIYYLLKGSIRHRCLVI